MKRALPFLDTFPIFKGDKIKIKFKIQNESIDISQFHFEELIPEMQLEISNRCDIATKMSLFLTCKTLYFTIYNKSLLSRPKLSWSFFARECMIHNHVDLIRFGLSIGMNLDLFSNYIKIAFFNNSKEVIEMAEFKNIDVSEITAITLNHINCDNNNKQKEFNWLKLKHPNFIYSNYCLCINLHNNDNININKINKNLNQFKSTLLNENTWKYIFAKSDKETIEYILSLDISNFPINFSTVGFNKNSLVFYLIEPLLTSNNKINELVNSIIKYDNIEMFKLVELTEFNNFFLKTYSLDKYICSFMNNCIFNQGFKIFNYLYSKFKHLYKVNLNSNLLRYNRSLIDIIHIFKTLNIEFNYKDFSHLQKYFNFNIYIEYLQQNLEINYKELLLNNLSNDKYKIINHIIRNGKFFEAAVEILLCEDSTYSQKCFIIDLLPFNNSVVSKIALYDSKIVKFSTKMKIFKLFEEKGKPMNKEQFTSLLLFDFDENYMIEQYNKIKEIDFDQLWKECKLNSVLIFNLINTLKTKFKIKFIPMKLQMFKSLFK